MAKTYKVDVIRSTAKAHLVSVEGHEIWVQSRSLKSDGTITQTAFDSGVAFKSKCEAKAESNSSFYDLPAANWESDKAVGVKVKAFEESTDCEFKEMLFFPKSVLKDGRAPGWIIQKKLDEAVTKLRGRIGQGTFTIDFCGFYSCS